MGNLHSALVADGERLRDAEIRARHKRELDILVLGVSGAGKTTIATQLRIWQDGGFDEGERAARRGAIYEHVVRAARLAIEAMQVNGAECAEQYNRENIDSILAYDLDTANQLWADEAFKRAVHEYAGDSVLMDSAAYFFEEVLRIGAPGYIPTDTDIVHMYKNTIGIAETRFSNYAWQRIHLFDVGTWVPECKKWIQDFEQTTMIVFCVALSDYDRASVDGKHENRMLESIAMFESVVNLECFSNTTIVLFLNKIDVFREKLAKLPLQWHFSDYSGGPDVNAACKYIYERFIGVIRAHRTRALIPKLITATEIKTAKWVVGTVRSTTLHNSMELLGFC